MNKRELIQYAIEQLFEKNNIDAVEKIFAENYLAYAENKVYKGHHFIKRFSKILRTSIPDVSVVKLNFFVEDTHAISWQRSMQGKHTKNMMGIPASNKIIQWNEMVISRFEGGKITEEWVVSELMGQLLLKQQLSK